MLFMFKKAFFIFTLIVLLTVACTSISAADDNTTIEEYESKNIDVEMQSQQNVERDNNKEIYDDDSTYTNKDISKSNITDNIKEASNSNTVTLSVNVKNTTVAIQSVGNEVVLTKNITTVNNKPDVTKLGTDYAYADDNGVYTILGSEIRRIMQLDSYCQQIYGYVPKYTYFTTVDSNVKYIISRQKWNVIARSLNSYHVNKGYTSVNTPYSITVNLTGKTRYYNVYYDAQEYINGQRYTCGPTAMSMISQALNCYASERKLAGLYGTTARDGTSESAIIKYSPNAYMKLVNIANTKDSVKSTLNSGKMVFWHISGHYMCVIGYNSQTDKFLCLNPSGPSHNIAAVQWATWTQMMNTDRSLKDHGFMAVSPYRNLSSINKTHAMYYYYNMGGKYTIPANNEYCNNGLDNKLTVTATTPSNIITKTNKTTLIIKAETKDMANLVKSKQVTFYLNGKSIGKASFTNGVASLNYTLPAYSPQKITITASNNDLVNKQKLNLSVSFNKFTAGKTYTTQTRMNIYQSVVVNDITAKKDDKVTLTAYIFDKNGKAATSGQVVFKVNGLTITKNNNPVKVNVKDGMAKLSYTIPDYGAKNYKLTAVYAGDNLRLEGSATLKINKMATKIIDTKLTESNGKLNIYARVVDINGHKVERNTKITIKIDSKTVIDKVKVKNGIVNMTIALSKYASSTHKVSILAGENEVYQFTSLNTSFYKTSNNHILIPTYLKSLKTSISNKKLLITANIVDNLDKKLAASVKLSVKINGKTVISADKITNGQINKTINIAGYNSGRYTLTFITGTTKTYYSLSYNTTITIP